MLPSKHLKYINSEKFRAELFKIWAIAIGTPPGILISNIFLGNIEWGFWLLAKLALNFLPAIISLMFFDKSYRIMKRIDEKLIPTKKEKLTYGY